MLVAIAVAEIESLLSLFFDWVPHDAKKIK